MVAFTGCRVIQRRETERGCSCSVERDAARRTYEYVSGCTSKTVEWDFDTLLSNADTRLSRNTSFWKSFENRSSIFFSVDLVPRWSIVAAFILKVGTNSVRCCIDRTSTQGNCSDIVNAPLDCRLLSYLLVGYLGRCDRSTRQHNLTDMSCVCL